MIPRATAFTRAVWMLAALMGFSMLAGLRAVERPGASASIAVEPGWGPPGTQVRVKGAGFPAGASGRIYWDAQGGKELGSFTTDNGGAFSKKVKFPGSAVPGSHIIWACANPKQITSGPVCASRGVKVTAVTPAGTTPAATQAPTVVRTECDQRRVAGEYVLTFDTHDVGRELRGTSSPEGVLFLGDGLMRVVSPSVATHSGSKALSMDFPGEFGSGQVPMRIGFTSVQDFVGMYVGLNERIWSTSPIMAVLTGYAMDGNGLRFAAATDTETFGPGPTPVRKCMSVAAPGIYEVELSYGTAGEPELIDDLILRGPATPVPVPQDDSPPRITVLLPEAGATVPDRYVRLQGEVREDRELTSMNLQLRAGIFHDIVFTPAGVTPEGERLYLFVFDPLPTEELTTCGENVIQIRARDSSDNLGAADVVFQYYAGDLAVTKVEAVQVVYGADLVMGKGTAFRAHVDSTFVCPMEAMFKLELPEEDWETGPVRSGAYRIGLPPGWEYPEEWGPVMIPARATDHTVMLPYIPPGQETAGFGPGSPAGLIRNQEAGGVEGPDVRVVPRPKRDPVAFAVEIDPGDAIPEQHDWNNRRESPSYNVVTTREMCFFVVPVQSGGVGPVTSTLNIKDQIEFILGTYPLAEGKVSWKTALLNPQTCTDGGTEDCSWAITDSGDFLADAAVLADLAECDYAIAIGPWGGGQTPQGYTGGASIGGGGDEALLAHEFNHSMTGVGDMYSLDCLVGWDEFYCEYADGRREYYCQDDELELVDGYTARTCWYEGGVVACEERTKDCVMHTGCSAYRRNEACQPTDVPTCGYDCAEATVVAECAGCDGYWSGPDCRIFHPSSDGFWVNRWQERGEANAYIMDCPALNMWMRLENTVDHCHTQQAFPDGYRTMLRNLNFVTGEDPEALLVHGVIDRSGEVELLPFLHLPQARLDRAPGAPGAYQFVLYDERGQALGKTGFDVYFEGTGTKPGPLARASFVMRIEWKPGTKRIALEDAAGTVLAEREVTDHLPQVEITSPAGGEAWPRGQHRVIRWTATDADGGALTYLIDVSPDGGKTWWPVAFDLTVSEYRIDTSVLGEGQAYLVRVRATDGVNTGEAITRDPLVILTAGPALPSAAVWGGIGGLAVLGIAMILGAWVWARRRGAA